MIFFVIIYLFITSSHCRPIYNANATFASQVQQQYQEPNGGGDDGSGSSSRSSFEYHHNNTNAIVRVIVTKSTSTSINRGTSSTRGRQGRISADDSDGRPIIIPAVPPESVAARIRNIDESESDDDEESYSIAHAQFQDFNKLFSTASTITQSSSIVSSAIPTVSTFPTEEEAGMVKVVQQRISTTATATPLIIASASATSSSTTPRPTTYHPDFFFSPFHTLNTIHPKRKIENRSISRTHAAGGPFEDFHLRDQHHPDDIFSVFYHAFSQQGNPNRGTYTFHTQTQHRHQPVPVSFPNNNNNPSSQREIQSQLQPTTSHFPNQENLNGNKNLESFNSFPNSIIIPTLPTITMRKHQSDDDDNDKANNNDDSPQVVSVVAETRSLTAASTAASLSAESKSISSASTVASSSEQAKQPNPITTSYNPNRLAVSPFVSSNSNRQSSTTTFHGHKARQIKRLRKSHASILPENIVSASLKIENQNKDQKDNNNNAKSLNKNNPFEFQHHRSPQQLFQTQTELPVVMTFNFMHRPLSLTKPNTPVPVERQPSWEQPEQIWAQPEMNWGQREQIWGEPERNWEIGEENQRNLPNLFNTWISMKDRQPKMTPEELFQNDSPQPSSSTNNDDHDSNPKIYELNPSPSSISQESIRNHHKTTPAASEIERREDNIDEIEFIEDDFTDHPRFYEIGEDEEDEPTELNLDNNTMNSTIENAQLAARSWELPELSSSSASLMSPNHHHRHAIATPIIAEMTAESIQVPQNIRNSVHQQQNNNNTDNNKYLSDIPSIKISNNGETTMIIDNFESQRSLPLAMLKSSSRSSIISNSNSNSNSESLSTTSTSERPSKKFGYVLDGSDVRKYRVEERTPDGYIVGEYGVINHDNGFLRGVRYTADSTINPRLIHQALMKFLSL